MHRLLRALAARPADRKSVMYAYKRETPSHGQWFTRARDEAPGAGRLGGEADQFYPWHRRGAAVAGQGRAQGDHQERCPCCRATSKAAPGVSPGRSSTVGGLTLTTPGRTHFDVPARPSPLTTTGGFPGDQESPR